MIGRRGGDKVKCSPTTRTCCNYVDLRAAWLECSVPSRVRYGETIVLARGLAGWAFGSRNVGWRSGSALVRSRSACETRRSADRVAGIIGSVRYGTAAAGRVLQPPEAPIQLTARPSWYGLPTTLLGRAVAHTLRRNAELCRDCPIGWKSQRLSRSRAGQP